MAARRETRGKRMAKGSEIPLSLFAPAGRRRFTRDARPTIPPPPWGGCVQTRTLPRVARRRKRHRSTRGYSPPPRGGGFGDARLFPFSAFGVHPPGRVPGAVAVFAVPESSPQRSQRSRRLNRPPKTTRGGQARRLTKRRLPLLFLSPLVCSFAPLREAAVVVLPLLPRKHATDKSVG
jgi:hypothetical protein